MRTALTLNGKKARIDGGDFRIFAKTIGLNERQTAHASSLARCCPMSSPRGSNASSARTSIGCDFCPKLYRMFDFCGDYGV